MIYIFLFSIWILLMGDFSDLSIILGFFSVLITLYLTKVFFGRKVIGTVEIFVSAIGIIVEMYKNTFKFIPLIYGKHYSGISYLNVKNKSKVEKAAIANCITLTPKTLFLKEENDKLLIHKVAKTNEEAHSKDGIWDGELF